MNSTNRRNRSRRGALDVVLIILLILCLFSAALLAIRLNNFIKLDNSEIFLESSMDTSLELFSISYENASGEVTVHSTDGERLVAPGTAVDYTLYLRNTEKTAIDYKLEPKMVETSEHMIPILVRMQAEDGTYIIGSENVWEPIGQINVEPMEETLKRGESREYLVQWQWQFESGNDVYDTELGSSALREVIGVSVGFDLHTDANTSLEVNGGLLRSDRGKVILMGVLFIILLILLVVLIIARRKQKKNHKA